MDLAGLERRHPDFHIARANGFSKFRAVTAAQIIDQIRLLPPVEQARVIDFARGLERRLTGHELTELAGNLVNETDVSRVEELQERIVAGFYGDSKDA